MVSKRAEKTGEFEDFATGYCYFVHWETWPGFNGGKVNDVQIFS